MAFCEAGEAERGGEEVVAREGMARAMMEALERQGEGSRTGSEEMSRTGVELLLGKRMSSDTTAVVLVA